MNDTSARARQPRIRRARLLPRRQTKLDANGETHRRDCECARCDAGFVPSELERQAVRRRVEALQGRAAAARGRARRLERRRLAQMDLRLHFATLNAAADAEVKRLRALRARSLEDRRLDEFLRLRQAGLATEEALQEVERTLSAEDSPSPLPPELGPESARPSAVPLSAADNDNGVSSEDQPGKAAATTKGSAPKTPYRLKPIIPRSLKLFS